MQRTRNFQEVRLALLTQGDTSTPSVVELTAHENGALKSVEFAVAVNVTNDGSFADSTNATIAPVTGYGSTLKSLVATKQIVVATPIAAKATGTLTISGAVVDGQKVVIGPRTYEFDANGAVVSGNVAVDISGDMVASQATLTVDTQPTAGNTMTIGGRTYVFVANGTANYPGEISVGTDKATAQAAIVAAINGTDGWNTANEYVSAAAFETDASVITARLPGTAGDAIACTETFTAGTNVFDAATLGTTTAGEDCAAADAVTALVAAITGDSSAVVTAADGAGDTVVVTAVLAGLAGNDIATTETMSNGAWGAVKLSGGVSNDPGRIRIAVTNATAETVTLRLGHPHVAGLCTDYTGSFLDVTHASA